MTDSPTPPRHTPRPAVVVTRPGPKARELIAGLEAFGAEVIPYPVMEVGPPEDAGPLDRACAHLAEYNVVLLTSANGVQAVAERVASWPEPGPKVAVVGEQTAKAVRRCSWPVHFLPEEANADGLLATLMAQQAVTGLRFLFPRAEQGREVLVDGLRAAGAMVDLVTAYRTLAVPHSPAETQATLGDRPIALVTFTSGACADHFLARMAEAGLGDAARGWPAAVIGPVTRDACTRNGMRVVAIAERPSGGAFLEAIRAYLVQRSAFSD